MLGTAFVRTADFEMLARGPTHNFVVGRRGAGKSALFLQLIAEFKRRSDVVVLSLRPEEYRVKGLVASLRQRVGPSPSYGTVRSLMRVVWRTVVVAHIAKAAASRRDRDTSGLAASVPGLTWLRDDPVDSALAIIEALPADSDPDRLVHTAATSFGLEETEAAVKTGLGENGWRAVVLIDGLDEGWRTHDLEIGMVGGLCAAAVDLKDRATNTHVLVFLRDNMFRVLAVRDDDFSRNIAADNVRLTWNHETLFDLVIRRLQATQRAPRGENHLQTWNRFAKRDLQGRDGFRECLRYTLYRPRDVLELLNKTIQIATRKGRTEIVLEDVADSALEISQSRLDDLLKEYTEVLPGLESYVREFSGRPAIDTLQNVMALLEDRRSSLAPPAQQTFAILGTATNVFQALFGVGFLGVEVSGSGFHFCHDGTVIASGELPPSTRVAVHPCYSRALSVTPAEGESFDVLLAVNDEYDEDGTDKADVKKIVTDRSMSLVRRLATIPLGNEGASDFEKWGFDVISLLFAGELSNIELHANGAAPLRRDVVGSNNGTTGLWRRMLTLYDAGQVIFELKNFEALSPEVYAQARAYQGAAYGKVAFIVYRSLRDTLSDNERSHVQQHHVQGGLLVLVPASILQRCLEKRIMQGNAKYTRKRFGKWVDKHERVFVNPRAGARD